VSSHKGKVVLVTGAGRGIGRSIAECFAAQGAAVGVLDFDSANTSETASALLARGFLSHGVQADVANIDEVRNACEQVERAFGPVDVLINNAGISPKHNGMRAEAAEMDIEEWKRVIDVNLTGCFNTVRVLAGGMKIRKSGSIINMSSVAGRAYCPLVGIHYSTTKAALIGFTRHLAGELGPFGITVNAIAPGRIDTPMVRTVSAAANKAVIEQTPLGRLGSPEDVAKLALYLTSEEANFITGQVCDVAGGWLMT
jgi:3-oxoacyl-[acyl-carrier protein] reductase